MRDSPLFPVRWIVIPEKLARPGDVGSVMPGLFGHPVPARCAFHTPPVATVQEINMALANA